MTFDDELNQAIDSSKAPLLAYNGAFNLKKLLL